MPSSLELSIVLYTQKMEFQPVNSSSFLRLRLECVTMGCQPNMVTIFTTIKTMLLSINQMAPAEKHFRTYAGLSLSQDMRQEEYRLL